MTLSTILSELLIPWQPNLVWCYITRSQNALWKKNWLLHSGWRSQRRVKMLMFVQTVFYNHQAFCFQTWYCDASLWVRVSCKKIDLVFSQSRSPQELIWSKYDNFYCVFSTADPFATKLGLIVHCHKPECLWRNWIVVFKVKVTAKRQNVSECLSRWYLLYCWTFYHQAWWCIIWARLSFKKIGLLSSRSRSQLKTI